MPTTLNQYILKKTIGQGGYGKVKLGVNSLDNKEYAIKIIDYASFDIKSGFKTLYNEVLIMSGFYHPNLILVVDFGEKGQVVKEDGSVKEVFYIVMELGANGDIFNYIAQMQFSESVARYYFRQLINGISEMHSKKICHRDLKPENLLLDEDFNLKIGDFGFAKECYHALSTQLGTDGYKAPEIDQGKQYQGDSVDVFAAGVILFIFVSKNKPFGKANYKDHYYNLIISGRQENFWYLHSKNKETGFYSDQFKDLINHMLESDPSKRYSIDQVKTHPWFNEVVPTSEEIKVEFKQRSDQIRLLQAESKALDKQLCEKYRTKYRGVKLETGIENEEEKTQIPQRKLKSYLEQTSLINLIIKVEADTADVFMKLLDCIEKLGLKHEESDDKYKITLLLGSDQMFILKLFIDPSNESTVIECIRNGCEIAEYYNIYEKIRLLLFDMIDEYDQLLQEENEALEQSSFDQ